MDKFVEEFTQRVVKSSNIKRFGTGDATFDNEKQMEKHGTFGTSILRLKNS